MGSKGILAQPGISDCRGDPIDCGCRAADNLECSGKVYSPKAERQLSGFSGVRSKPEKLCVALGPRSGRLFFSIRRGEFGGFIIMNGNYRMIDSAVEEKLLVFLKAHDWR